jgi:hypothetical protein
VPIPKEPKPRISNEWLLTFLSSVSISPTHINFCAATTFTKGAIHNSVSSMHFVPRLSLRSLESKNIICQAAWLHYAMQFIYFSFQFCDVGWVPNVHKYIYSKFGDIPNMKVGNLKHLFNLIFTCVPLHLDHWGLQLACRLCVLGSIVMSANLTMV